MSGGSRFRRPNGPSVPPKSDYSPTRSAQKPPGYAAIEAVSAFPLDAPEWNTFVRDVMQMPETYAPAVQDAIQQQRWKISPNPIAAVRTAAHQAARRMGLQ